MKLLAGVQITKKTCKGPCGRMLPIEAFNRKADAADGHQSYCVECGRHATKRSMRRLRGHEASVREKVKGQFDDWCAAWLRRHPQEGNHTE